MGSVLCASIENQAGTMVGLQRGVSSQRKVFESWKSRADGGSLCGDAWHVRGVTVGPNGLIRH